MSRINCSEDEDFPGQFGLWQGNCDRSLAGRRGQAALRELEAALVAMPEKALHAHVYVAETGDVCALGALAVQRNIDAGLSRADAIAKAAHLDPDESQEHGEAMGFPSLAAWAVVAENDIQNDHDYKHCQGPNQTFNPHAYYYGGGYTLRVEVTPEERYTRMLAWVREHLKEAV